MNTKLKFIARLFLIGFVLLGQGCMEEDFPLEGLPSFRETDNWAADRLQRQLQEQSAAYDKLLHSLPGGQPLYPHVRLITMPDYGLCYFIPYGDARVEGAVFYPLDSELREDGTYLLDCALKDPDCIDARRLNEDIPITRRFLYSIHFKELQSQGVEVNPALVVCADELSGNFVYISQEESSFGVETRAWVNMIEARLRFSGLSYGTVNSAGNVIVQGLSRQGLIDLVKWNLGRMRVNSDFRIDYYSPGEIRLDIPTEKLGASPGSFFPALVGFLDADLRHMGYSPYIQYDVYEHCEPIYGMDGTRLIMSGGGGGGGSSPSTGNLSPNPVVSDLYADNSTLNSKQRRDLEKAFEEFVDACPQYKEMVRCLMEDKIKFEIDYDKVNQKEGLASYYDKVITFRDPDCIRYENLREELIHAVQDIGFYGMNGMKAARKNVEFEAKVIQDIVNILITGDGGGAREFKESEIRDQYSNWIINAPKNIDIFVDKFNYFCEFWMDYQGSYRSDFVPKVIKEYFKNINKEK